MFSCNCDYRLFENLTQLHAKDWSASVNVFVSICVGEGGLGDVASAQLATKAEKKNKNKPVTSSMTSSSSPAAVESAVSSAQPVKVMLSFKRNIFDPRKQMLQ